MLLALFAGWPAKPPPSSLDLAILKGTLSSTTREKLELVDGWPTLDPSWQEAVIAAANYVWKLIDEIENATPATAEPTVSVKRQQSLKDVNRGDGPRSLRSTARQAKGYR
jgi:hypothetical protein